jgi:hypothetical protein
MLLTFPLIAFRPGFESNELAALFWLVPMIALEANPKASWVKAGPLGSCQGQRLNQ